MADKIKGGYYIKARKIQQSDIMRMAPCAREVWDWLLCHADHNSGQVLATYADVREALAWQVGWRKQMYTLDQIRKAYESLTKAARIHTKKSTRKTVVTIINYLYYQDQSNYAKPTAKPATKAARKPHEGTDDKQTETETILLKALDDFEKMRKVVRKPLTPRARELIVAKLQRWYPGDETSQVACLEQSIENSWLGIFELKDQTARPAANPAKVRF